MTRQAVDVIEDPKHCGIQVIARAAAILRTLSANPQGLSLAAIAQQVDLPRSTVQRIVNALETEFMAEALGPAGGFRSGPALGKLLHQTQTDIISVVHPQLELLSQQFQESAFLTCLSGTTANLVDHVTAERELRIVLPIGTGLALHTTAPGKAILACMTDLEIQALLPAPLQKMTPNSLDMTALLHDLDRVRNSGVATDIEEHVMGVCSFSVALQTYMGLFAIGLALPASRLADQLEAIQDALLAQKRNIEARIGASPASDSRAPRR